MPIRDLTRYQRNLPYWLPPGEIIFLTIRLAGSLPPAVLDQLRHEHGAITDQADPADNYAHQRRYFGRFDAQLDKAASRPLWLANANIAHLVQQALHFPEAGEHYQLLCYCVMANHVHLVVSLPDGGRPLALTLKSIKSYMPAWPISCSTAPVNSGSARAMTTSSVTQPSWPG